MLVFSSVLLAVFEMTDSCVKCIYTCVPMSHMEVGILYYLNCKPSILFSTEIPPFSQKKCLWHEKMVSNLMITPTSLRSQCWGRKHSSPSRMELILFLKTLTPMVTMTTREYTALEIEINIGICMYRKQLSETNRIRLWLKYNKWYTACN